MDHDEITRRIREANPDVLFVCFGCPKQEKWMAMHHSSLGVPVSLGVGGTLDFIAGHLKRAPRWMQQTGTEWVFRLLQEPKRLFRRYVRDFWVFGMGIAAQWWRLRTRRRHCSRALGSPASRPGEEPDRGENEASSISRLAVQAARETGSTAAAPVCDGGTVQRVSLPSRFDCAATRTDPRWVDRILADGRHCLIDMSAAEFLDSTGIGVLIRLRKSLRAARKQLVLVAPSKRVARALAMMRLESFFDFAADEASASRLIAERVSELSSAVDGEAQATIAWRGEVTAANADEVWAQTKAALAGAPPGGVRIDLSRVRFIDSTGLGLMVRARKLTEQQGNTVTFLNAGPVVSNVVRVAGLEGLLFSTSRRHAAKTPQARVAPACAT
jgi:N-acetylglucosaminyldiphosphoundecaprenol N-acetyl-beta-D-mannosaminyltransferase